MKIHELKPAKGATHSKKRVGRGGASGHGGTSTRGHKGQNSRSGGGTRLGFEGGQMPLIRRIPKRGFNNKFKKIYSIVNVETLQDRFNDNDTVTKQVLVEKGLAEKRYPVKILGNGSLEKKLNVKAAAFTASAKEKITGAKGTVEVV